MITTLVTMSNPIDATFIRDSSDPSVIVLDGHAIQIKVKNGELVLIDGMCGRTRERILTRTEREIRRIVVIGHSGHITIEALNWINGVGRVTRGERAQDPITLQVVDITGNTIFGSDRSAPDNRLHRAQSQVDQKTATELTRWLLRKKFAQHSNVIPGWDSDGWINKLDSCTDKKAIGKVEAREALDYWAAWYGKRIDIKGRVPRHWYTFDKRNSPVSHTPDTTNRNAGNPINALLNYCLGIAKSQARLACHVHGLDPGLGVHHVDHTYADGLVLDAVEIVRPNVEKYVLDLIENRTFDRDDFIEMQNGCVRVARPLTSELSEQCRTWYTDVKPAVAHICATIRKNMSGWQSENKTLHGTNQKTGRKKAAA